MKTREGCYSCKGSDSHSECIRFEPWPGTRYSDWEFQFSRQSL